LENDLIFFREQGACLELRLFEEKRPKMSGIRRAIIFWQKCAKLSSEFLPNDTLQLKTFSYRKIGKVVT